MALSIHADMGLVSDGSRSAEDDDMRRWRIEGRHPALVAFREAGGTGDLWVRSSIPSGRGLGFSGAMRVGAAALGLAQRSGVLRGELPLFLEDHRRHILQIAAELEGHADNAAASLLGGVVACLESEGTYSATNLEIDAAILTRASIVVWVPDQQTATAESRAALSPMVERHDAVFNMARLAYLIRALASGDRAQMGIAVEDRLHQEHRLGSAPMSRRAIDAMRQAGATACWLSGSGPTVAAMVFDDRIASVEDALSSDDLGSVGRHMRLHVDTEGLQAAR